ncbi:CoB--CoM heterodisulfide reductase iron-sulfur subunit B family protein [Desulforhabdus sp. TSK]|uniref:CoB--CoM heterodisulfide reductase iron-sulfur subunit B family protein n=1 Tax=Desulforhabdus sp. TSK TaxID=2925014 RepID=UPI001FC7F38A|nr:CoB--CoM heterodisulfide reductase iron-sulfur subunit B family protein [Desulforhabdus sp. TSK]GKT10859.1 heterodisulfide reductase subunit B [Desulforhabdus sp. TSK]
MKRIAYYQGCSLEGLASEYDISTRAVCDALGIELIEIPDWNCCGSSPAHSADPLLSSALAGRNLAIAEAEGCDVVMTPCPGCLKSLKGALETCHDPQQCDAFREILGMPFEGRIRAISVLELLYKDVGVDALRAQVQKPYADQVIVPYYGCLLTRPPKFADFDDPENPVSMDRLLEAVGVTVPDFPYKTECCGATYGVTRNDIVGKLTGRILDMALRVGAEAVAVACPLCQQNLDLRQAQVNRHMNRTFDLPVVYITQVIGIALGIAPKELGLDKLFVNADFLLRSAREEEPQAKTIG